MSRGIVGKGTLCHDAVCGPVYYGTLSIGVTTRGEEEGTSVPSFLSGIRRPPFGTRSMEEVFTIQRRKR